jgi:two-component system, cell cycle response regulator
VNPQRSAGELVPLADRARWMVVCRLMLVCLLGAVEVARDGLDGLRHPPAVVWAAGGWLLLTIVPALARRARRGLAVVAFTIALLGDGVLLAAAWYAFGGLGGPVGYLVILHGVAVTLLASFRTGAKLALWHSLLALIVTESVGAGVLRPDRPVPVAVPALALYLGVLWAGVLATASLASVNERELRRRRYDSEVLRGFGLALTEPRDGATVAAMLARFGRDELLGTRVAVLVQPAADDAGYAVLVSAGTDERTAHRLSGDAASDAVVRRAVTDRVVVLAKRLDASADPVLAGLLPGARNVVVVPFSLDEVRGALVLEHPRRSSQRRSQRVERRMLTTAEQATAHASMAIDRALLVERIRQAADIDGLTHLANRRRFDSALAGMVAGSAGFAVVMVDLDHFKQLNDRYGHQTGDEALRVAARAIGSH